MTVLMIDDNPIDLLIHEKLLRRQFGENVNIVKVQGGPEALEYLGKGETPNLTLLDIKMPIMNGFEFLDELEKKSSISDYNIHMISSSIDPIDISKAESHKLVKGFFEKPLSPEKIKQLMNSL